MEFEVVPGVSSALAAPAYAGIPLTHRGYSSSVTVVTGREADTKGKLDWAKISRRVRRRCGADGCREAEGDRGEAARGGEAREHPGRCYHAGYDNETEDGHDDPWGRSERRESRGGSPSPLRDCRRRGRLARPEAEVARGRSA